MKKVVVLGGAFFALGNANPAAEANVSAIVSDYIRRTCLNGFIQSFE